MNNKISKFLLCENPIADKSDGRTFILHTRTPRILAEVFHCGADGDYTEDEAMEIKRAFPVGATLDYSPNEYIIFGAIWIEETKIETQRDADNIAAIMRRMADWYEAYLTWEDAQQ